MIYCLASEFSKVFHVFLLIFSNENPQRSICASNFCFFWVLWWVGQHFKPNVHLVFYLEWIRFIIALIIIPLTIWREDSRNFERKFEFNSISLPKTKSLTFSVFFNKYIWKFLILLPFKRSPFLLFEATQDKF